MGLVVQTVENLRQQTKEGPSRQASQLLLEKQDFKAGAMAKGRLPCKHSL